MAKINHTMMAFKKALENGGIIPGKGTRTTKKTTRYLFLPFFLPWMTFECKS